MDYEHTLVSGLSQGNRQKLALMIALLTQAEILCLDEPTNGLDITSKRILKEQITRLVEHSNLTILMTTHDLAFTQLIASRVLLMKEGEIVADTSFEELMGFLVYEMALDMSELEKIAQMKKVEYTKKENTILLTTREKAIKEEILQHCQVLSFSTRSVTFEEMMYKVLDGYTT